MLQGRARQRVEIRVERRQLFLLFLVGLLVAALTFSVGVMTGKRLDALAGGGTEKGGISTAGKAAEIEKAVKKDAAPAPAPAQVPLAAKEGPEPKAAAQAPEKPDTPGKPDKTEKAAKEPPEKAEAGQAPKPAAKEKEKEPEKAASGPPVKEPKEPSEGSGAAASGEHTIQIAALPDRNQAVALAAQMEKKGYKTHISTTQVAGKGTMYRVRIGRFKTKEEADAFREDYLKKEKGPCFVTPVK
ncbi:MAG: SPOR domain-containing protein [Deltaproteobacteria bacterium]|nr:SPOR domain-containing protein [Deltaproteobacteria bacterium]